MPNYAYAAAVDDVAAEIIGLKADPTAYSASDRAWVEGVLADYNALSDQDRADLDARHGHKDTDQPLGRVLEVAVWSVHSYDSIDNWTTLPDGIYDASTTPALSSSYSKGKSTSPRQKPWSVKSVTVSGGQATATITVESDTYPGLWMGGKTYPNTSSSGNCEFEGIPIDLNSTFYFAGVSSSMPIPIAFSLTTSIEEPAYVAYHTVTFRDGYTEGDEGILKSEEVEHGMGATAPEQLIRDGFVFYAWDKEFSNVTSDLTVNAIWHKEGVNYYTVTFYDGPDGNIIDTIENVEEGSLVTPPEVSKRPGYTFVGWDHPELLDNVTSDLTIIAQWMSDDEVSAEAVRKKIEAIPAVESLIGDTDNPAVAEAGKAYIAMTEAQRSLLDPKKEQLRLVRALIAVLPGDPFDINLDTQERVTTPIKTAQTAYGLLSEELQAQLDKEAPTSSRTYGRHLESAVWALDSLRPINDITILKDGTYSTGITSTSTRGKSTSARDTTLTVKSVTVKDGHVTATVECSGTSYQTLFIGGKKYENTQTEVGAKPQFEIPLNLNSTVHFSVKSKSATEETEAVAFEMTVSADEGSMTPDPKKEDDDKGGGSGGGTDGSNSPDGGSPSLGPSNSGGSNAGNLSSLLRTGSTGTGSSSANGALADSEASKSASSKSNNVAGKGGLATESASANGILPINLAPAIAGGTLFAASLGCLAFALRFVRREELLR
ncbi:MAG: InlB B-repeat-containing protein [Eggerthellaceae bacterium]|nr:InlB B-repeat-containing protein [Eggerthellaceae bacterium]